MSVPPGGNRSIYRHKLPVRITHWVNVVCLMIMLMSGLQIFNAHPALYWGQISDFEHPLLVMEAQQPAGEKPFGVTTILGYSFHTTGLFGLSSDAAGRPEERGFPSWATIPSDRSLAVGRSWHFFFAWLFVLNGVIYLVYTIFSNHLRHDLVPSRGQLAHIGRSILDHLRFRFPQGEEARRYNVLQKLSYLIVVFCLLPLIVLAGLTLSPQLDTAFPFL